MEQKWGARGRRAANFLFSLSGKIKSKHYTLALLVVFLLSLVPLFMIAQYNFPTKDDFYYTVLSRQAWQNTGSLWEVVKAAAQTAARDYTTNNGAWLTIFLIALHPMLFDFCWAALTPLVMIAALTLSTCFLCHVVGRRVFKMEKWGAWFMGILLSLLSVQTFYSPYEALYWASAAVTYTFCHSLALVCFGLAICFLTSPHKKRGGACLAGATALAGLLGGAHLQTALYVVLFFAMAVLFQMLRRNAAWKALCIPAVAALAMLVANAAAPGYQVRQLASAGMWERQPGLVRSVFDAFYFAYRYAFEWMTPEICLCFVLFGLAAYAAAAPTRFSFRWPGLVTGFSVCWLAAGLAPSIYAMGEPGSPRNLSIVYYTYLFLLALNILYWIGWGKKRALGYETKTGRSLAEALAGALRRCALYICLGVLLVLAANFTVTDYLRTTYCAAVEASGQLASGDARQYGEATGLWLAALTDPDADTAVLGPLPDSLPHVLVDESARCMPRATLELFASYFGKSEVLYTGPDC